MDEKKIKSPSNEEYLNEQALTKLIKANHGIFDYTAQPFCNFRDADFDLAIKLITGNPAVKALRFDIIELPQRERMTDCFANENCQITSLILSSTLESSDGFPLERLKTILEANKNKSLTAFYFPFNSINSTMTNNILNLLSTHKKVQHLDMHKRRMHTDPGIFPSFCHFLEKISPALINFIQENGTTLKTLDLGVVHTGKYNDFNPTALIQAIKENLPTCSIRMLPYDDLNTKGGHFVHSINDFTRKQKKFSIAQLLESFTPIPTAVINTIILGYLKEEPLKVPYHTNDPKLASLNNPVEFLKQMYSEIEYPDLSTTRWTWMTAFFRQLIDKLCEYQDKDGLIQTFLYLLEKDNVIYTSLLSIHIPTPSKSLFFQQPDHWADIADSIQRGLDYLPPINPLFQIRSVAIGKNKTPMVHLLLDDMPMGLKTIIATRTAHNLRKLFCTLHDKDNKPYGKGEEMQKFDERLDLYSKTAVFLSINLSDYQRLYTKFKLESYGLTNITAATTLDEEAKTSGKTKVITHP